MIMQSDSASARAADPGTPLADLRAMLVSCPDAVLSNPAWALAEATEPQLWASFTEQEWSSVIQSRCMSPEAFHFALDFIERARTRSGYGVSWWVLESEISLRADAPREVLARIAAPWRPEVVNGAAVEIAHHRLGLPDGSVDGWHAITPVAYLISGSVPRSRATKGWDEAERLVRGRHVHPRAPVLEYLPVGTPYFASHAVAAASEAAAGAGRSSLALLAAYVLMSKINSRFIDTSVMLKRAMLRRWEGRGEFGRMPARCAAAHIGGNRVLDPWESESEFLLRIVRRGADRAGRFPEGAHDRESLARRGAAYWVTWIYLASTRCRPDELVAAARSHRWEERLAAASNPTLSAELRDELSRDIHLIVRGAARERWEVE